jgi:tetratricopeptide (TPR) repeat protein
MMRLAKAPGFRVAVTSLATICLALAARPVAGQAAPGCEAEMPSIVEAGWREYRSARINQAEELFERAAACLPDDVGARVGLAYAAMRQGHDVHSRELFEALLDDDPELVDGLVGLGLLAWRDGEAREAAGLAERAIQLAPQNVEARALFRRTSVGATAELQVIDRAPLVLPDTLEYPARTNGDRFEIRTANGWEPFYMKGVNLGAALPGKHPSQFPDSATYALWIDQMSEMGANVVRSYTIHPPTFYQALLEHNRERPDDPLWLVHGVWTDLPPDHDYEDPVWEAKFFEEMRRVVDLLHGLRDISPQPGHAAGN